MGEALREKVRQAREIAGTLPESGTLREAAGPLREAGLSCERGPSREAGPLPVAVGFGIQTPQHAAAIAEISDAVVVGSELIRVVDRYKDTPDLLEHVADYTRSLKEALR